MGFFDGSIPRENVLAGVSTISLAEASPDDPPLPEPPVASFTFSPADPVIRESVTFTSTSTDDVRIVNWHWDFGDGTTVEGEEVTHAYTEAGEFTITLTVTDNDGLTASVSETVTVRSECHPPSLPLFVENTGALGLVEGIITNERVEAGKRNADFHIENFLRLWLDVDTAPGLGTEIVADEEAGLAGHFAAQGLIPPCGGGLSGCREPGRAAWKVSFCSRGTIPIFLTISRLGLALTILDGALQLGPVDLNTLINLASELEREVPKFAEAISCSSPLRRGTFRCAAQALRELIGNKRQRNRAREILRDFGIELTLQNLLRLPNALLQIQSDYLFFFAAGGNELTIIVEGDF